jgi:hypothetical protein
MSLIDRYKFAVKHLRNLQGERLTGGIHSERELSIAIKAQTAIVKLLADAMKGAK